MRRLEAQGEAGVVHQHVDGGERRRATPSDRGFHRVAVTHVERDRVHAARRTRRSAPPAGPAAGPPPRSAHRRRRTAARSPPRTPNWPPSRTPSSSSSPDHGCSLRSPATQATRGRVARWRSLPRTLGTTLSPRHVGPVVGSSSDASRRRADAHHASHRCERRGASRGASSRGLRGRGTQRMSVEWSWTASPTLLPRCWPRRADGGRSPSSATPTPARPR